MSAIERRRPTLSDAGLRWPTLAMLVALSILLGLGTWQWNRKAWKEELIATIQARSVALPVTIEQWLGRACRPVDAVGLAASCEYVAVRLTGTFDHAHERRVYTGIAKPAGGGLGGQGYWIMTPFKVAGQIEGRDVVVAVSRGFVPEDRKEPATRAPGQSQGEVEIVGLIRSAEPRATFTGENAPTKNVWYLRSPAELFADQKVLSPRLGTFFVDLVLPKPQGGLPEPTAVRINIPNRHLEYALTWWALALTLIGVYGAFVWSRLRA